MFFILLIVLLFSFHCFSQQGRGISNVDMYVQNNIMIITYDCYLDGICTSHYGGGSTITIIDSKQKVIHTMKDEVSMNKKDDHDMVKCIKEWKVLDDMDELDGFYRVVVTAERNISDCSSSSPSKSVNIIKTSKSSAQTIPESTAPIVSYQQLGCISGDCQNGQGRYNYSNSSVWWYEGEWENGQRNGQGTYTFYNGDKYVGEWKNQERNGLGTETFANGGKYEGEWKGDKKNGQGTYTFPSGAKYIGEWKDDKQEGKGIHIFPDGDKFVGEFKDGLKVVNQGAIEPATPPKPKAPADLVISNITFTDNKGNDNKLLDANENAEIKFTVSNRGKGEAYSLVAKIKEKNLLKGIDYSKEKIIGSLAAGKDITLSIPVSGNIQLESGKADFEILIKEGNGFDADPFKVSFNTQEFKHPTLALADYKFTTNEEGKIKLGQTVSLNIVVQNKGQGDASDVKINFVNPNNIFPANETSFSINKLKPNESKNVNYEFFANKKYEGSEIPIQVVISESYKKYGESKTLTVSLEQTLSKTQQVNVNAEYGKMVAIDNISLTSDVDKNIPLNHIDGENKFALIIGNEDYTSYQQSLSNEMNVEFATNDALVFKEYCIKTFSIPEKNITCLLNATTGKISQAIDKINMLIKATKGKANVIVYYAGHGLPDEKTKDPYLIPVDVSGSNISSAIKLSTLYEKLTEHPSQQVTVFLDACFSGGGRDVGLLATRGIHITPKSDFLKGNIVVFAASSGEESSLPWKDKQHGMFTYFLLKKFQETNGNVSFSELDTFLKDNVGLESVRTNSKKQNPQVLVSPTETGNWGKLKLK